MVDLVRQSLTRITVQRATVNSRGWNHVSSEAEEATRDPHARTDRDGRLLIGRPRGATRPAPRIAHAGRSRAGNTTPTSASPHAAAFRGNDQRAGDPRTAEGVEPYRSPGTT